MLSLFRMARCSSKNQVTDYQRPKQRLLRETVVLVTNFIVLATSVVKILSCSRLRQKTNSEYLPSTCMALCTLPIIMDLLITKTSFISLLHVWEGRGLERLKSKSHGSFGTRVCWSWSSCDNESLQCIAFGQWVRHANFCLFSAAVIWGFIFVTHIWSLPLLLESSLGLKLISKL